MSGVASEVRLFFDKFSKGRITHFMDDLKTGSVRAQRKLFMVKNLVVQGIATSPDGKNLVIVNGQTLSEGEAFAGVTVKKIDRETVELDDGTATRVLRINESMPLPERQ